MGFQLKPIRFSLDPDSIDYAIRQIHDLKTVLKWAVEDLIRELTDKGVEVANIEIASMGAVDSSVLIESIQGWYDAGAQVGHVYTDLDYAILVEYGTGVVGESSPHPGIGDSDWHDPGGASIKGETYSEYDQNKHGMGGWWYPSVNGWYIPKEGLTNEEGLPLAWTMGMPSRPFMYYTMKELEQYAEEMGGQIIAKYIHEKGV